MKVTSEVAKAMEVAIDRAGSLRKFSKAVNINVATLSRTTRSIEPEISDDNGEKLISYLLTHGFLDEDDIPRAVPARPKLRDPLPNEVEPLKQWLLEYMEGHNLDNAGLSQLTSTAESTFERWFSGRSIPRAGVIKRLREWKRSQNKVQNRREIPVIDAIQEQPKRFDGPEYDDLVPVHPSEFVKVPIVGLADAAGFDQAMGSLSDYIREFHEDTYEWHGAKEHYFCVQVRGNSLMPDVMPGSLLCVAGGEWPSRGDLTLAKLRDGEVVAKWYERKDGHISLSSSNPEGKSYSWNVNSDKGFVQWMFPIVKIEINPRQLRRSL